MEDLTFNELPKAVAQLYSKVESIEKILLQQQQETQPESDSLLTIQQASELLKVSVPTIYGYVHRREIPVSKRKKRLYFSKQELLVWIEEGRKKTMSEIEEEANVYLSKSKEKGGRK